MVGKKIQGSLNFDTLYFCSLLDIVRIISHYLFILKGRVQYKKSGKIPTFVLIPTPSKNLEKIFSFNYHIWTVKESLKKKCNLFYIRGGGQDRSSLPFFYFSKTLNFFIWFLVTLSRKQGGPECNKCYTFFFNEGLPKEGFKAIGSFN